MSKKSVPMVVPIWEKSNLTIDEAAAYTNIGANKLRELSERESCDFVIWVGNKRLFRRKKLDDYLDNIKSL